MVTPMKILVTAGPTREFLDPVRFLSNRSSGRMGYAVAAAAREAGHTVRLVSGPTALAAPEGVETERVTSAAEMLAAVEAWFDWCDALVMAAAVADFRPRAQAPGKVKKQGAALTLELEPTADILATLQPRKGNRCVVGFAAETGDPLPEAARKLARKGLDLIVANDVTEPGAGFDVDTNRVTLLDPTGHVERLPLMSKAAVARELVKRVEAIADLSRRSSR